MENLNDVVAKALRLKRELRQTSEDLSRASKDMAKHPFILCWNEAIDNTLRKTILSRTGSIDSNSNEYYHLVYSFIRRSLRIDKDTEVSYTPTRGLTFYNRPTTIHVQALNNDPMVPAQLVRKYAAVAHRVWKSNQKSFAQIKATREEIARLQKRLYKLTSEKTTSVGGVAEKFKWVLNDEHLL